jgi:hypothetical protein
MPTAREREAAAKGTLGYSAWDRFAQLHYQAELQSEFVPIDIEAVRCEQRTVVFEKAVAHAPDALSDADLARDYKQRVTYLGHRDVRLVHADRRRGQRIALIIVVFAALLGVSSATGSPAPVLAAGLWAMVADALYCKWRGVSRSGYRSSTVSQVLAKKACVDCDYDLSGALPGIDPQRLAGSDVGPRVCPECKSPWPLLPPSVSRLIASGRVGTPQD